MPRNRDAGATDEVKEVEVVMEVAETPRRVVLVEDNLPLRDVLADEIRDLGFEVVELSNGVELLAYFHGLTHYQSPTPEVVVAEVELPAVTGAGRN